MKKAKRSVIFLNNIKQAILGTDGKRPDLYLELIDVSVRCLEEGR